MHDRSINAMDTVIASIVMMNKSQLDVPSMTYPVIVKAFS